MKPQPNFNRPFANISDASSKLIDQFAKEEFSAKDTIVLAVSTPGVYFASAIAQKLHLPLDILIKQIIYSDKNPELPLAAVSETKEVVLHKALTDAFEISEDYLYSAASRHYKEDILPLIQSYRASEPLIDLHQKRIILVDECVETGLTMMVALKSAIQKQAKHLYIATPILERSVYNNLLTVCDGVYCPHLIKDYTDLEYYYDNYTQLDLAQSAELIKNHNKGHQ